MELRKIILTRLQKAVAEHSPMPFSDDIDDDDELDVFGLDSLAFMELLTGLEKDYPETFGDLVSAYEKAG